MKVKCRGYTGDLVYLRADEECLRNAITGDRIWAVGMASIEIRQSDGTKVELDHVTKGELEAANES